MRRGAKPRRAPDANLSRARESWPEVPEWIAELARACDREGQAPVARRLGYSPSVVSQVLSASYGGDYAAVLQAVRGELMADRVVCPVLGDIALSACLDHQDAVARGVRGSELRIRLSRACPTCTQNRKRRQPDAVE